MLPKFFSSSFFFCIYSCVYVFVWVLACMYMQRPEKGFIAFPYHSLPISLRQGLSLNLGILFSWLSWKPAAPAFSYHMGSET